MPLVERICSLLVSLDSIFNVAAEKTEKST